MAGMRTEKGFEPASINLVPIDEDGRLHTGCNDPAFFISREVRQHWNHRIGVIGSAIDEKGNEELPPLRKGSWAGLGSDLSDQRADFPRAIRLHDPRKITRRPDCRTDCVRDCPSNAVFLVVVDDAVLASPVMVQ